MISEPMKESLKELGRLILFAVVGVIVSFVLNYLTEVPQTETVIILTAVLRWADKFLHERSKEVKKPTITGLAPF